MLAEEKFPASNDFEWQPITIKYALRFFSIFSLWREMEKDFHFFKRILADFNVNF